MPFQNDRLYYPKPVRRFVDMRNPRRCSVEDFSIKEIEKDFLFLEKNKNNDGSDEIIQILSSSSFNSLCRNQIDANCKIKRAVNPFYKNLDFFENIHENKESI